MFHVKCVTYETLSFYNKISNKMPKTFTSETQKTGELGENIAVKFLMKHGFLVLDRN